MIGWWPILEMIKSDKNDTGNILHFVYFVQQWWEVKRGVEIIHWLYATMNIEIISNVKVDFPGFNKRGNSLNVDLEIPKKNHPCIKLLKERQGIQ